MWRLSKPKAPQAAFIPPISFQYSTVRGSGEARSGYDTSNDDTIRTSFDLPANIKYNATPNGDEASDTDHTTKGVRLRPLRRRQPADIEAEMALLSDDDDELLENTRPTKRRPYWCRWQEAAAAPFCHWMAI